MIGKRNKSISFCQSVLNAFIGSCFAAFLAGKNPNAKPTAAATPKDKMMEAAETTVGISTD